MAKKQKDTTSQSTVPKSAQELKLEGVQNLYNFLFEAIKPYTEVLAEFKTAYEEVKLREAEFRKIIDA